MHLKRGGLTEVPLIIPFYSIEKILTKLTKNHQEYEEQAIAAEQDVGRVAQIDYFISNLEELNAPVTELNNKLWISMVDQVVVHSKEDIQVVYWDGIEK